MKKILSLLGTISLITSVSNGLIGCNKNNDNENKKDNKIDIPIEPKKPKQEQPPKDSNWKLINGFINEKNNDNKNYFGIIKIENGWKTITWIGKRIDWKYQYKSIYRWDGIGKPNTLIIDSETGKITDWKLKRN